MRIPNRVKNAINTYYAFQGRAQLLSQVPQDWKLQCLTAVSATCSAHSIGMCAAAGTFFLVKGKQKAQISVPFLP